nr:MAG TPA: hypothetical protein [Bacteriophage sp.]DAN78054.1 MAG TPA: hypothetical protein [Bacteriophage sp.]DAY29023.1 MAG TPA: hypothetical protein [Bacteriophage sp.]
MPRGRGIKDLRGITPADFGRFTNLLATLICIDSG